MASVRPLALVAALLALAGCTPTQRVQRADLFHYLYPQQGNPYAPRPQGAPADEVRLQLPLRVGVAFVPASPQAGGGSGFGQLPEFSEPEKRAVLERIAAAFRSVPEVASVDVLPGQDLTGGGGFDNLSQIAAMYGVNLVALVSYSQAQYRNPSKWSVLYWTLIAAYFVPADKVETQTLLDASVFDVPSHALLFAGSGSDISHSTTTPFETSEQQRVATVESFDKAADKLIASLEISLAAFREHAKAGTVRGLGTPRVQVLETRASGAQGGAGGGAFGPLEVVAALLVSVLALRSRRD